MATAAAGGQHDGGQDCRRACHHHEAAALPRPRAVTAAARRDGPLLVISRWRRPLVRVTDNMTANNRLQLDRPQLRRLS